jgi:hypothetical protein
VAIDADGNVDRAETLRLRAKPANGAVEVGLEVGGMLKSGVDAQ